MFCVITLNFLEMGRTVAEISHAQNGGDWTCSSGDMLADRQTDRHTNMLITTPYAAQNNILRMK